MKSEHRITHRDIALRFGCDKSTVSLALRGNTRIPLETRERLRALAEEMGYRPDPAVESMARYRWAAHETGAGATLAFVVNRKRPFYNVQIPCFLSARERARERGFELIEFDVDEYASGRAASRVLYHRGIRGLVLSCIPPDDLAPVLALDWGKFTIVSLAHGWGHVQVNTVGNSVFASTQMVWREVAKRGYRRIGAALLRENPPSRVDAERLGASMAAQQELCSAGNRLPFLLCGFEDRAELLAWVKEHRPDAVIGRNKMVYQVLCDAGYRIPGDFGFARLNAESEGPIAGVSPMYSKIGRAVVDNLIAQMQENRWGLPEVRQTLQLEPEWLEGDTLPTRL